MATKERSATTYNVCSTPENHRDHMCHLMEKGKNKEIQARTSHPAYYCANCGARANEKEDLCNPQPLPGS
jgi:hypothetical protein